MNSSCRSVGRLTSNHEVFPFEVIPSQWGVVQILLRIRRVRVRRVVQRSHRQILGARVTRPPAVQTSDLTPPILHY